VTAGIYNGFAMNKPSDLTPVEKFFDEWRRLICPICDYPQDIQQREPILWLCAMCRKWFNEKLERV
jgi:hypothetical protein